MIVSRGVQLPSTLCTISAHIVNPITQGLSESRLEAPFLFACIHDRKACSWQLVPVFMSHLTWQVPVLS